MKPLTGKILMASLAAALSVARPSAAEDIDLFTTANTSTNSAPNVLIIIDNSANWNSNSQAWPVGKQGEGELYALRQIMQDDTNFKTPVNMGLMMFSSGSPDSGYIRYAIRTMDATTTAGKANRKAFMDMIGTSNSNAAFGGVACVSSTTYGASAVPPLVTPNCILQNFSSSSEETNSASTKYSNGLYEAFKYFGGYTDPAHANLDATPSPYVADSTHFGPIKYGVNPTNADTAGYTTNGSTITFNTPVSTADSCAKNYIIFIGNGYPSQDGDVSTILTSNINGASVANTVPTYGNKSNTAAKWTKYLYSTDVNAALGRQYVTTFTIDVYNAKQDTNQTALLQGMAKYGGGQYFAAKDNNAILNAIKDILVQIQSVNSVFASASLPINATNRTQNQNQVFIGVFRPDPDAKPKWYGNLKEYQIAKIAGTDQLADSNGSAAVSATTGFLQPCAVSFWTTSNPWTYGTSTGYYWDFSAPSAGTCTLAGFNNAGDDTPDGGIVEKGGVGEVLRKGNGGNAAKPYTVNRTMYTCTASPCTGLTAFNTTNVTMTRTGAPDATTNTNLVNFTLGQDVLDENGDTSTTEPRASIHGDLVHSRPLPVNFGGTRGVELYYGSNDGTFRAVNGTTGRELWSFIAPEHLTKLLRLYNNSPLISYPNMVAGITPAPTSKDYFFDGSIGVFQNSDNSKVWIYPTMRRGGRMIYGFDVTTSGSPALKWAIGCPNPTNDTGCTSGMSQIGLTFSAPQGAFVKGYSGGSKPLLIVGGGYDTCEDTDSATTTCTASSKGNIVYVLDADTGAVVASFSTGRSVAADITLVDRDFDGMVDAAYVLDTGGSLYRIDFTDPSTITSRGSGAWTMTKIAYTTGASRKFLFGPSAVSAVTKVFLAFGSGDRERPLISNYPYTTPVQNRFYMFIDTFTSTGLPINLDGGSMANFTTNTDCSTQLTTSQTGWFMDLTAGTGEQVVTSSVIFGGTVFFSTNRPTAAKAGTCSTNLGEARGYAVNLLNASGVVGSGSTCGGSRSGVFNGGGIPPSPVVGTVPVYDPATGKTNTDSILIGGIDLSTGTGSPIGAQKPPVPTTQARQRLYFYPDGDK